MKKTLMTFLAVGFGVSVAFAQTTGEGTQQDTEMNQQQTEQTEQSDNLYGQEEEGKRQIEMYELPVAVQDAFKNGQYSNWEVLAIYEMTDDSQQGTEGVGVGTDTETDQGVKYAFELVQNGQGDQSAMGQDDATTDDGLSGVETERVSEREADVMVIFDENGQVVKEKNADELKKDKEHKKDKDMDKSDF